MKTAVKTKSLVELLEERGLLSVLYSTSFGPGFKRHALSQRCADWRFIGSWAALSNVYEYITLKGSIYRVGLTETRDFCIYRKAEYGSWRFVLKYHKGEAQHRPSFGTHLGMVLLQSEEDVSAEAVDLDEKLS